MALVKFVDHTEYLFAHVSNYKAAKTIYQSEI